VGSPALLMAVQRVNGLILPSVGFLELTDAHTDGAAEHHTREQQNNRV